MNESRVARVIHELNDNDSYGCGCVVSRITPSEWHDDTSNAPRPSAWWDDKDPAESVLYGPDGEVIVRHVHYRRIGFQHPTPTP